MSSAAVAWLLFNIVSIIVLGFYSMLEMAAVSVNKVRLQYWVSKGSQRAQWLTTLLQNPSQLFGTTLIGVNVATVVGAECSREFYAAIGLNPSLAPLTQVIIVVIFGELAPMFAARHYPEHVANLGIPIIYASSKLLYPVIWILGKLSRATMWLLRKEVAESDVFLSEEELEKILELRDEEAHGDGDSEDLRAIASNIFRLKGKDVSFVMSPLTAIPTLPSNAIVKEMIPLLKNNPTEAIPIYYKELHNIVGIARPRDLIRAPETRRIRDYTKSPWFVTEHTPLSKLLLQFRRTKEDIAVVVDRNGRGTGIVTLAAVLEEIFGKEEEFSSSAEKDIHSYTLLKDKTFLATMTVAEFNRQCEEPLKGDEGITLSTLVTETLGHPPEVGDSVTIGSYELTVKETSFLEVKTLTITTRPH